MQWLIPGILFLSFMGQQASLPACSRMQVDCAWPTVQPGVRSALHTGTQGVSSWWITGGQNSKPKNIGTFKASSYSMTVNIPLSQASHMVKPNIK